MGFHAPRDLTTALHLAAAGVPVVAGGTDLYPALGEGPLPGRLLDLGHVADLAGITRTEGPRCSAMTPRRPMRWNCG